MMCDLIFQWCVFGVAIASVGLDLTHDIWYI